MPFHVALTATDAPYSKWQCRIMYYCYKKNRDLSGSEMGGFTRILHSGKPENLMDEMPTVVVDPLPAGRDRIYLMAEPDHILVNPLPNLARGGLRAAFPFFYIEPAKFENIVRKYYPEEKGPVTDIDPIGNSPVIIKKVFTLEIPFLTLLLLVAELRYAYAVAAALNDVQHVLRKDFMLQVQSKPYVALCAQFIKSPPPWDLSTRKFFIIHYTYGCDCNLKGQLTYGKIGEWRFDKRSFLRGPPPKNLPLPPPGVPESVVTLVKMVNEATANIPNWDAE
ncbi:hypothetical protein POTOM_014542 [Populus tomentosa]|uniref:Hydroxyproline O-arabinosyltransferase-like domain-containing protein n=1 Tax=Populus tomentosa TaxID=118781 RepID=A0A8X8A712_POPTO|nr:hypothetical protein POTOM_014542 [Populus tomentosa]